MCMTNVSLSSHHKLVVSKILCDTHYNSKWAPKTFEPNLFSPHLKQTKTTQIPPSKNDPRHAISPFQKYNSLHNLDYYSQTPPPLVHVTFQVFGPLKSRCYSVNIRSEPPFSLYSTTNVQKSRIPAPPNGHIDQLRTPPDSPRREKMLFSPHPPWTGFWSCCSFSSLGLWEGDLFLDWLLLLWSVAFNLSLKGSAKDKFRDWRRPRDWDGLLWGLPKVLFLDAPHHGSLLAFAQFRLQCPR